MLSAFIWSLCCVPLGGVAKPRHPHGMNFSHSSPSSAQPTVRRDGGAASPHSTNQDNKESNTGGGGAKVPLEELLLSSQFGEQDKRIKSVIGMWVATALWCGSMLGRQESMSYSYKTQKENCSPDDKQSQRARANSNVLVHTSNFCNGRG